MEFCPIVDTHIAIYLFIPQPLFTFVGRKGSISHFVSECVNVNAWLIKISRQCALEEKQ